MIAPALQSRLNQLAERIDALSLRERGLVFLGVMGVIFILALNVFLAPLRTEHKRLEDSLRTKTGQIQAINQQVQTLIEGAETDADAPYRAKIAGLERELVELDRRLDEVTGGTVSPQQMAKLLEQILARKRRLELVRIENLPPVQAVETNARADARVDTSIAMVYRHGVRLEFRGRYFDIVDYLKALETLPWKVFWGEVSLETERYPVSRVVLVVHTLSRHPGWVGT